MKALLILFLTVFHFASAQAAGKVTMTESEWSDVASSIKGIVTEAVVGDEYPPTKVGMKPAFYDLMYSLYMSGYLSTTEYEDFKRDYENLGENPTTGPFWEVDNIKIAGITQYYANFFGPKFNSYKATPENCVSYLGIVNHGQCCSNLVPAIHLDYPYPSSCGKKESEICNKHSECCTGVCSGLEENGTGVCEAAKTCFQEINTNEKCGKNNPICKDRNLTPVGASCINIQGSIALKQNGESCGNSNECRSSNCEGGVCTELMKCIQCVRGGSKEPLNLSCCPGFYRGEDGKCIQDWPPFILPTTEVKRPSLLKFIISQLFFVNDVYAADPNPNYCDAPCNHISHLPASERKTIEDRQKDCTASLSGEDLESCLATATNQELDLYKKHHDEGTINQNGSSAAMGEYINEYNLPFVTATGLSDIKTCTFNSLKDDWNDSSNLEKNAEMTLRAFEYMYSGSGADFWTPDSSAGSIFASLKDSARDLRHNRSKFIEALKENDKEMACLCIASFGGVSKYPDKKEFFESFCANSEAVKNDVDGTFNEDGSYTAGLGVADNGGQNIDGMSSNEDQSNNVQNLNLGATGLSHQKLLVKWLERRSTIQLERYVDNSEIETRLQKVIEYLRTQPWFSNNQGKSIVLYEYAATWPAGFFKFFGDLFRAIISLPGALLHTIISIFWKPGTEAAMYASVMGVLSDPSLAPKVEDSELHHKKKWSKFLGLTTAWYNHRRRTLIYNESSQCQLKGPSHLCLKNAFISPVGDFQKEEGYYLVDVKRPLFVSSAKIKVDDHYTDKINNAFQKGLTLLKKTEPTGKRKHGLNSAKKSTGVESKDALLDYYYMPDGSVSTTRNQYNKPILLAFAPEYNLKKFDTSYRNEIINGIKIYARCYHLKECITAHPNGGDGSEFNDTDIGFKLFFADGVTGELNESELDAFAEYVYQLHYKWPSMTERYTLSYPLPGMLPYFEAILYNIKLLGSLQLGRSTKYHDTYMAYEDDWQKKYNDYLSPDAKTSLGEKSKNVKYGKAFWAKFKEIDLSGGGNVDAYQSLLDSVKKSNDFNSAELAALGARVNGAIRAKQDKDRRDQYMKAVGNTASGKETIKQAKEFMNKFNSPLDSFPNIAGSRFNSSSNGAALAKSSSDDAAKKDTSKQIAAYTPTSFDSSSYGRGGNEQNKSVGETLQHGLSDTDVERILNSSEADKSLYSENPNDTLFIKVSKAYKRNLDRVLIRKSGLVLNVEKNQGPLKKVKGDSGTLNQKEKEDLKKLLKGN